MISLDSTVFDKRILIFLFAADLTSVLLSEAKSSTTSRHVSKARDWQSEGLLCAAREDLSVDFLAQISPITAKALADPVSSRHGLCRVKAMHPAALKVKQIQVIDNERAIRRLARV